MKKQHLNIQGIPIELERKRVKNVNFTIYPPDGRVRISAPRRMPKDNLYQVIHAKIPWIKKHRARIIERPRRAPLKYVSGEDIPFLGELYQLEVFHHNGAPRAELGHDHRITLWVREGSDQGKREKAVLEWYRKEIKVLIPTIIARYEPVVGVEVAEWGVKRMKTRWGSCNTKARRIWVNLELAKHPIERLEYIVVHEMVHLLERGHNKHFYTYMDQFLPGWKEHRDALKAAPAAYHSSID